jgi:hypothetical protein
MRNGLSTSAAQLDEALPALWRVTAEVASVIGVAAADVVRRRRIRAQRTRAIRHMIGLRLCRDSAGSR